MKKYDVIIIGGGAAGLFAARSATARGRKTLILDMGDRPGRKVFVSGGGRCNFTNSAAGRDRYVGQNPDFVKSALARVKPADILKWAHGHGLSYVEKSPGQFFCATSGADIVSAMITDIGNANMILNTNVIDISKQESTFIVHTDLEKFQSSSIIIATGGMSFPNIGVSDFGYKIAKQFGHKIVPIQPGLVGLKTTIFPHELSGISLPVTITVAGKTISDSMLFTHFGIGGPAAYRASLLDVTSELCINFMPSINVYDWLCDLKKSNGKKSLHTLLGTQLPAKFAKWICDDNQKNLADYKNTDIAGISDRIQKFKIPGGTLKHRDFNSAEVTIGGVSTEFISSKTMESKLCPGLYFAGEVLDITGDLGGFNLHFAFASGITAGEYA